MSHGTEVTKISALICKVPLLFQPDVRLSLRQFSIIIKKSETHKSIRVTDPQTFLSNTMFQQQEKSALQDKQRCQSPKNNPRNRSLGSQNQTIVSQSTAPIVCQPIGDPGGLPKLSSALTLIVTPETFFAKKIDRPRIIVEVQLKKIYIHSPVRHDDSSGIVCLQT